MASVHDKSGMTILLDVLRHLLIIGATMYIVSRIWIWQWVVALIAAIPIYVIILNIIGFLMLPLYSLTPETRLGGKIMKAYQNGDPESAKILHDEFKDKFNVRNESEENTIKDDENI